MARSAAAVEKRLAELSAVLQGKRRLLIVTHDNPDPDAIASGWALMQVVRRRQRLRVDLAYGGTIGRGENRAMREVLKVPLKEIEPLDLSSYQAVALVDCQPLTGNNSLPLGVRPAIVIDHHPLRKQTRAVPFHDVREDYGSTAAILGEYLEAAEVRVGSRLATALFYAIKAETQNLGREASRADVRAFLNYFPLVDNKALSRIEHPPIPRSYFSMFDQALDGTRLHGPLAVTLLGEANNPDVVAEFADLLVRLDSVRWALVIGRFSGDLVLSFRTDDPGYNAGRIIQGIIGEEGKAGGHVMIAGGKVDGGARNEREAQRLERLFRRRAQQLLHAFSAGARLVEREPCGTERDASSRRRSPAERDSSTESKGARPAEPGKSPAAGQDPAKKDSGAPPKSPPTEPRT